MTHIEVTVDGTVYEDDVEPRLLLAHYLRDRLGLTGTPIGCDTSTCGACTVDLDGATAKSCSVPAVQADGCAVTTVQGLAEYGAWTPLQRAFHERHALPCGCSMPRARPRTGCAPSAMRPAGTTSGMPAPVIIR
ncbi:2Fe-2S iron-sulfur cluster binding domain-containing protein [Streptomyces sp. HF10]|nr:2Fe-2S iron-sulfur cluster-binding protein [Streptomyces sp. HF10]QHC32852.1 2Fe-2S iron-sulfur cluster binding domain-containing protein [Streptomyces sp. HF10]